MERNWDGTGWEHGTAINGLGKWRLIVMRLAGRMHARTHIVARMGMIEYITV